MLDFISKNSPFIYLALEVLAAVTGIIYFKKYKNTKAKYFIYFLIYIVLIVSLGNYTYLVKDNGILDFLDGTLIEKNHWWFNLFWNILGVAFYGWYYLQILGNHLHIRMLKFSLIFFLVFSCFIIVLYWKEFFMTSFASINVLGALIILQCVFYYFLEILQSDKILTFYKSLNFYITCAILVLWLIQTPLVFFQSYFGVLDMDYVNLRDYINLIIITFMYVSFTIGIIVSNPDYD